MSSDPIYKYPAAYAREHGELAQFRESRKALSNCRSAIDAAIRSKWDGWSLTRDAAKAVVEQFGPERVVYVLANTVQQKADDTRFSQQSRDWAKKIPMYLPETQRPDCILESHSVKVDQFIDLARKDIAKLAQQKSAPHQKHSVKHEKEAVKMDKRILSDWYTSGRRNKKRHSVYSWRQERAVTRTFYILAWIRGKYEG